MLELCCSGRKGLHKLGEISFELFQIEAVRQNSEVISMVQRGGSSFVSRPTATVLSSSDIPT